MDKQIVVVLNFKTTTIVELNKTPVCVMCMK